MSKISMAKGGFQKWLAVTVASSEPAEHGSKFDTLVDHPDWDCNNIDLKISLNGIEFDNLDDIIQRVDDSLNEKDSFKERVEQLENTLRQLLYTITPVANSAFNIGQDHKDWDNINKNLRILNDVRESAYELLKGEENGQNTEDV